MENPYKMTISLNVLNHLGIGLYSNIPAVLSEVVANSWDADASLIEITIDPQNDKIVAQDSGLGMDLEDINEKFLKVGYRKREVEPAITQKKRHVMGRKGIGKLSVFSIAEVVEIYSVKNGQVNAFRMDLDAIRKQIHDDETHEYLPEPISTDGLGLSQGTKIVLTKLKKSITRAEGFLRKRLARRFSVIGQDNEFRVFLNGTEITSQDRDFFGNLEFLWHFGSDAKNIVAKCTKLREHFLLDNMVDKEKDFRISGWIGSVDERKNIDDTNNSIVVFAHGKLIHEDILKDQPEGGIYSKYLIGEIDADFMDLDNEDDIVTSNRQNVKEDDSRYIALKAFVWSALKKIQADWKEHRKEAGAARALKNPVLKEWYDRLTTGNKKYAKQLFGKIESMPLPDITAKKELYKASLLAFEKMALSDTLNSLEHIETDEDFLMITALFGTIDELEATHYYEIAKGRLSVIKKFDAMLPNSKERALQEFIFEHIWLLDPSWERAAYNMKMEETINKEFKKIDAKLTAEEKKGRIDIKYRTSAGKHIIIELKKYGVGISVFELCKQINKYYSALDKCLKTKFPQESHHIEVICILGKPPIGTTPKMIDDTLKASNARFITYDTLINDSLNNYSDYLEREKKVSELIQIIEKLDLSIDAESAN